MSQPKANWDQRPTTAKKETPAATELDNFVSGRKRKTKRLNVEISVALHTHLKAKCALEGREIRDVDIELLEQRFPEQMKLCN